jgi:hypothetical protein
MNELKIMEALWSAQTPHACARTVLDRLAAELGPIDDDVLHLVADKHRRVADALDAFARRRHRQRWAN